MFNTSVPIYGILILIAIVSGLLVIFINSKRLNYSNIELVALFIYLSIGMILGGKLLTLIFNINNINKYFNFLNVGLTSYGAVIGAFIMTLIYSKQFNKNLIDLVYIMAPSMPLMYSIGKIGCFLSGCCYGISYNGIFSVTYKYSLIAPNNKSLFPIQLLESIIFFLIFIFVSYKFKKNINKVKLISYTSILCGLFKFLLDYLRMSHNNIIISGNQIISIMFVIAGISLYIYNYIKE